MNRKEFLKLVNKYNQGTASEEEMAFLKAYDQLFDAQEDILDSLSVNEKSQLKARISEEIHRSIVSQQQEKASFNWRWLAAAVLVIVGAATIVFWSPNNKKQLATESSQILQDTIITPGKNEAVLILADGQEIILNKESNGLLVKEAGVVISKNRDGLLKYEFSEKAASATHLMRTPRGGQYQLVLSDGTKVWLNAASSLSFPTQFENDERKVELTGEAYFEVAKDSNRPFKVVSNKQLVEVLGTHFNINTYEDEATNKTTLLEGSVKVSLFKDGKALSASAKILKPGEQASLSKDQSQIILNKVDPESAVAWKNGYFKFDKIDMQAMMRQVSRWYDVDVEYRGKMNTDLFVGNLKRSDDISEVLRILEMSKIDAHIENKTIIINN